MDLELTRTLELHQRLALSPVVLVPRNFIQGVWEKNLKGIICWSNGTVIFSSEPRSSL
jgi:hypothetical protein